jgi:hypothetical protein
MVLYAHYQWLRTNEENAKIALAIHQQRGYGPLTGGWGDPSAPQMIRAYSQVFGVEIGACRRPVEWGEERLKRWMKTADLFHGTKGIVFSRDCQTQFYYPEEREKKKNQRRWLSLVKEIQRKDQHLPGKGEHHGPDALRYFFAGWARS